MILQDVKTVAFSDTPLGIAGVYQSWVDPPIDEILCEGYDRLVIASAAGGVAATPGTVDVFFSVTVDGATERQITLTFPTIPDPIALYVPGVFYHIIAQIVAPLPGARFCSIRYTNGAIAQTYFRLYAYLRA